MSSSFWYSLSHWQRSVQDKFFVRQERLPEEQSVLHWQLTISVMAFGAGRASVHHCIKFSQLFLRKITEIGTTRCQILRLKCTKFDFGWGSAPDPVGGAYSAPPVGGAYSAPPGLLAGFKGALLLRGGRGPRGEGREREEEGWGKEGREGKGKEGREDGVIPPVKIH